MSEYIVSSGVTSTGVDLSYGSMFVLSGGVANDTTTTNGGMLYVSSGGLANSTTVNEHGHLIVYFGGEVNSTTVAEWEGYFSVDSGGVANNTTLSKGYLDIYSGGVANGITVISGSLRVCSGGTATDVDWAPWTGYLTVEAGGHITFSGEYSGVYYGKVNQLISSGSVWDSSTMPLTGDLQLWVMNGGIADGATDEGSITVYSGGMVSNTTVDYYSVLSVSSGGTANSTTVNNYGCFHVCSDGSANSVTINSGGSFELEGGMANNTMINDGGQMLVSSGGIANNVTVSSGGDLYIRGGTATEIVWTPCEGHVGVDNAAHATFANEYSGVYYGSGGKLLENAAAVYGMTLLRACEMYVMNGGVADNTTVNSSGYMQVSGGSADHTTVNSFGGMMISSGGIAANTTINSGGSLSVRSGGTVNDTTVNYSGRLVIESGGVANDTTLSGGEYWYHSGLLEVYSGGTANGVVINPKCVLEVSSGGTATNVDWTPCEGHVWGDVTFVSQYSGVYYGEHNELLSNTAVMDGKTLYDDYEMYVMEGGTANHTILSSGGSLWISSGGVANDTNVYSRGYLYAYGGGVANSTTVNHEAWMFVYSGGTANSTTLSGRSGWGNQGMLYVESGAVANDTLVKSYGNLVIYGGGVASNVTVKANGKLMLGGKLTGRMTFEYGAVISGWNYEEGILDFDISDIAPSNTALVNDLSCIQVMPRFTLTVSGAETTGSYRLVGYAADFDKTITVVNTSGVELGTLAVADGTKEIDGVKYALTLNKENVLSVMVGEVDPNVFTGELTSATKEITAGSSALCVDVNISGLLKVLDGGTANYTTVNSGGTLYVSEGGVANYTTLNRNYDDDGFTVFEGGVASNTTLDYFGTMIVSSGGSAIDTTLLPFGRCIVYGVASNTVNSGGELRISSGGVASNTTVVSSNGLYVYDDGTANETTISSGAGLFVHGGVASNTTVHSSGELFIHSGGTAVGATANASGGIGVEGVASNIIVNSDGVAEVLGTVCNVTISSGGRLYFGAGGKLTGKMTFENGAVVSSFENSFVDFDLTRTSIGAEALLNNLSAIAGETPLYTLTVGGSEAYGEYKLAEGAADFNETITVVNTSGTKLGTLTVGKKAMAGGAAYTLNLTDGSLSVTVEEPENGPLEPLNNYLYDAKKAKEDPPEPVLNTNVTEEYGTLLTVIGQEIRLDKIGTVDSAGYHNHVGTDDVTDFAKITLEHGARVSFDLSATDATKFSVWSFTSGTDKKGNTTYKQKSKQAITLKKPKGATTYSAQTKNLFLEAGVYYVSMQSTNAKKGGDALYNVTVNGDTSAKNYTIIYDDGDDGWNNYLYDKKQAEPLNPNRFDFKTTHITSGTSEVLLDSATSHADETGTWKNFVGFGDATDFARIQLDCGASISFAANATDASKFTIWKLVTGEDKKGNTTYTQKSLQATTLKKAKGETLYSADTKKILLEAGDYYISMQSTNAKKGGNAYYSVTFDEDESVFYSDADGGWNNYLYDSKTKTLNPYKDYFKNTDISAGTEARLDSDTEYYDGETIWYNFAGFTDSADFAQITLDSNAMLSFALKATDATKFTIWRLDEKEDKKGNTVYTQKSLQATTLKKDKETELFTAETKLLSLDAGVYYVSMESTNASKGGHAYYDVKVGSFIVDASVSSALEMPMAAAAYADSVQDKLFGESGNGLLASL